MDSKKKRWLKRHGYKPITESIALEWVEELIEERPGVAKDRYIREAMEKFSHFKRYGKEIVLYTLAYLENSPLNDLKRKNRKNIIDFVIRQNTVIRTISNAFHRIQLAWYRYNLSRQ